MLKKFVQVVKITFGYQETTKNNIAKSYQKRENMIKRKYENNELQRNENS